MEAVHPLQRIFATAQGEAEWCDRLRVMIEAGELAEAERVLETGLAVIDSRLAQLCREARRESVAISGWPELVEAISLHEGEPVTGIAIAIANEADLAFEKGRLIAPYLMLGIYTDEAFAWSRASRDELLAETKAESPAWAGSDEDIEAYLEVEGLDALNTALVHHKQRHFIREGDPGHAPLRYVEYVLGCWWRALRFHQAVATEFAVHGLPGGAVVVSGLVDMAPEVVTVHMPQGRQTTDPRAGDSSNSEGPAGNDNDGGNEGITLPETVAATLFSPDFVPRRPVAEVMEISGTGLRRRFVEAEPKQEPQPVVAKPGLLARLFGRR